MSEKNPNEDVVNTDVTDVNEGPLAASEPSVAWIVEDDVGNWLAGREARYATAMKENAKTEKENPQKAPFESKYAAREIFAELLAEVEARLAEKKDQPKATEYLEGVAGLLLLQLGNNFIESEETSEGERHLGRAKKYLEPLKLNPRFCGSYIQGLSSEGILWANRSDHQKSHLLLQEAVSAYQSFLQFCKGKDPRPTPGLTSMLLPCGTIKQCWHEFESAHTHSLFYLAQCYGHLGQPAKSAEYCVITLQRQLIYKTYDPLDWAINAAGISQYYLAVPDFETASHCLLCASAIAEEGRRDTEMQQEQHANIARCWIKYLLNLLSVSLDYRAEKAVQGELPDSNLQFELDADRIGTAPKTLAKTPAQAQSIFNLGEKYCTDALKFYTLEGHVTDYVAVEQDRSQFYRHLCEYVSDPDHKCKLHKRRVDMLTIAVKELNPQYFLAICRQLYFELAEITAEMMSLKRSRFTDSNRPDDKAIAKMNRLTLDSIKWFTEFVDSCRENNTKAIPETLDETVVRPFLVAQFTMARLHSKILVSDTKEYLKNMRKSQEMYQWCVTYCEKHPDYDGFSEEFELCKEMVELLPRKIRREIEHAVGK